MTYIIKDDASFKRDQKKAKKLSHEAKELMGHVAWIDKDSYAVQDIRARISKMKSPGKERAFLLFDMLLEQAALNDEWIHKRRNKIYSLLNNLPRVPVEGGNDAG